MALPEGIPYPSKKTPHDVAKRDKRRFTVDPIDQINHDREANKIWRDTVIEGTDLQRTGFRGRLYQYEEALLQGEVMKARETVKLPTRGVHHPKTPLPIPKQ